MELLDRLADFVPNPFLGRALVVTLVIVAAWVLYAVLSYGLGRIARAAEGGLEEGPRRRRVATVFVVVDSLIKGAIIFVAAFVVFRRLGVSADKATGVVATVVIAWVVYRVLNRVIAGAAAAAGARIQDEGQRQRVTTLIFLGDSALRYTVLFVAGLSVLGQFDIDLRPVLAGAGVLGLAIGFGAQNLVRDVISGFFIIMEGQYAVGDLVEINGVFGRVEWVGLRTTRLRQPDGQLRHLPNGSISTANNYTEDYVGYVVNIPLPAEEPADPAAFAMAFLRDFDREFRVFADAPAVQPVESLPTYTRLLRVRVRAIPGRHTVVEQKLPARAAAALERAGHKLPAGTDVTVSLLFPPPGGTV